MSNRFISRGFHGRRQESTLTGRIPPGQYLERGFPVLSAGPTPHTPLERWDFTIEGEIDRPKRWTWEAFRALPHESITADIHCVTKWSKLDTRWEGVSVDTLLAGIESAAEYVIAFCDGGYTTNLPLETVTGGKAWVVYAYEGQPIPPEHGGPARLLVPQRYFWKSAKWVRGLRLLEEDEFTRCATRCEKGKEACSRQVYPLDEETSPLFVRRIGWIWYSRRSRSRPRPPSAPRSRRGLPKR